MFDLLKLANLTGMTEKLVLVLPTAAGINELAPAVFQYFGGVADAKGIVYGITIAVASIPLAFVVRMALNWLGALDDGMNNLLYSLGWIPLFVFGAYAIPKLGAVDHFPKISVLWHLSAVALGLYMLEFLRLVEEARSKIEGSRERRQSQVSSTTKHP